MAKKQWYAWHDEDGNGGVSKTWDECQRASSGKRGEKHKGFQTYEEAWDFAHPGESQQSAQPVQQLPVHAESESKPESVSTPGENTEDFSVPWEDSPRSVPESVKDSIEDPEPKDNEVSREPVSVVALDMSRADRGPICEKVNQFCQKYEYDRLSEDQRRAVQAVKGKYLLFAVPGSGKTTVIMARTGYLINCCGVRPEKLMTMTFTRASAKEMRDRYCAKFVKESDGISEETIPDFRTIHSFCFSIVIPMLRKRGFSCPAHVVNEDMNDKSGQKKKYLQRIILANTLRESGLKEKATDEAVQDAFQTAFTSIKNREMTKEEYSQYSVKIARLEYPLAPVFEKYQEILRNLHCMDFDDMLVFALKGLQEKPEVLQELRERYEYWSVDEAQDNSKIQHELMQLLAGPDGNLFMVGDDDQSIYSFRGAEPNLLLAFGSDPDVHLLVMGTNYRSDSDIVDTSREFIEYNDCRADKQMNASHTDHGLIAIPPSFETEADQYVYIVDAAKKAMAEGKKLGVLYQLNVSALPLIVHMHREHIPFEASKGLADLLRGKLAGNILRIMRFAVNPCSMEKFTDARKSLGLFWINEERLDHLKTEHERYRKTPILKLVLQYLEPDERWTVYLTRYVNLLEDVSVDSATDMAWKIAFEILGCSTEILTDRLALYTFLSVCDLYPTVQEMLDDLDGMIRAEKKKNENASENEPQEEEKEVVAGGKPVVTLSTIHSAKGREWDYVMVIDAFEETFPGKPQFERIGYDPQEPRRVFYVAATRAIHRLDILTVDSWHGNSEVISSFVINFAWLADQLTERPTSESVVLTEVKRKSSAHKLEPNVFYGVPVGRKPGVYTNWDDVQEQIKGFSIPAGKNAKKLDSYEEAWAYAFPGIPIPARDKQLDISPIEKVIHQSGGTPFNRAMDLPEEVREGLLSYLGVTSLFALPGDRILQMRKQSDLFGKGIQADYHGHTDGYAVVYLPVNFYKIWLPLWKLLEKGRLPMNPIILELGPGPGTATWSLLSLYKVLALRNPQNRMDLTYTAVELEKDFAGIFRSIWTKLEEKLPPNLSVHMNLLSGQDAFDYIGNLEQPEFDLIVESNLLNQNEDQSDEMVKRYLSGVGKGLKAGGHVIMIEPGTNEQILFMENLTALAGEQAACLPYETAVKTSVYLMENSLVQQAIKIGLRYSRKIEHWFSYLILEKAGA